jgi:phosphoglycolate phosphatase
MSISYKENVFMIGDTCMDMISAKDSGIERVGVLSGYASEKELRKCTNIIKNDTKNAVSYIKKIIKL